jgi:hypothetical protein
MTQLLQVPADSIGVTDLDTFVKHLSNWHQGRIKMLQHLITIPDTGIHVRLEGQDDLPLVGDYHKGFLFGLNVALGELGVLPFVAEMDEPADKSANDQNQS